jgi:hypothetical protein
MDRSVLAAIARFPDRGHAIEELAQTDEDIRSLCADLAEAEAVLKRWRLSSSPVREARCTEYRDLVRDLVAELEVTLDRNLSRRPA